MRASSGHIPYLDGWRGIAILAVLFSHFIKSPEYWWVGRFGVQLFLVLSGYLMCHILFVRRVALSDFFARRSIRILPTFLLFVGVVTAISALSGSDRYMPSAANILAIVTFTRTYLPLGTNIFDDALPIGHFWSLNVEEHSYIFLAIIAALTRRFKNDWLTVGLLFAASLVTLAFSYWYFNHPPSSGSPADVRTESASLALLASVAVAYAKYRFPLSIYQKVPTALPIAAIGASFLCFSTIHFGTQQYLSPLLLALSINFFDRAPAFAKAALSNSILRWFGVCSFSLYLWQQPFLALEKLGGNGPLMLCAAVAVGGVSFYYFENPVRIWLTAAWNKRAMTHNTLANDPLTSDGPLALIDGSLKK